MSPRSFRSVSRWPTILLLLLATALAGCDLFREAGTREAVRVVQEWIHQPAADYQARAGELALPERQAMDYLRALREQGIALVVRVEQVTRTGAGLRRVELVVGDKSRDGIEERARFLIDVARNEQRQWRVSRLERTDRVA